MQLKGSKETIAAKFTKCMNILIMSFGWLSMIEVSVSPTLVRTNML